MSFFDQIEISFAPSAKPELSTDQPLSLALGMFDGVHLGHQNVIGSAIHEAQVFGGYSGVLTFDPHPSRLLRPEEPTRLIYSKEQKQRALFNEGIDFIIWKSFTLEFSKLSAEDFLSELKKAFSNFRSLHVGANFRFGRKRLGDVCLLEKLGNGLGIDVFRCDRVSCNGEIISSTLIRKKLLEGDIRSVNQLLGRSYTSEVKLQKGNQMGRKIGFPTLNFSWNPELRPLYGVYIVRMELMDGSNQILEGVANYGIRPTVDNSNEPILEVHIIKGNPDLPAESNVRIQWLEFIRSEQKFDSIDALKQQIAKDKAKAEEFYS